MRMTFSVSYLEGDSYRGPLQDIFVQNPKLENDSDRGLGLPGCF